MAKTSLDDDDDDDELQLETNPAEDDDADDDDDLLLEENADEDDLLLEENDGAEEEEGLLLEDNNDGTEGPGPEEGLRQEKIAQASVAELRERGNAAFRAGRVEEARLQYSDALTASHAAALGADTNSERSTLLANRAACALKLRDWAGAINDCTAALSHCDAKDETRAKALYRRATAFFETGDIEGAWHDLADLPVDDPKVASLRDCLPPVASGTGHGGTGHVGNGHVGNGHGGVVAAPGSGAITATPSAGLASRRWRVSCISPTTPERHLFHEIALYRCFQAQTHPDLELIVVDTGAAPSPFFTSKSFKDDRVTYLWQAQHQTIGEKRNLAIQHATGDIICHFDDDDLYAPEYIATMVACMEAEDADFVKLSAWLIHDLQTGDTGLFDAPSGMPHPSLAQLSEQFLYTYGFSFLYRRALFPTFSFAATSWGEDQDILKRVRDAGRTLALYRDLAGICLHNQHGENCSRSFAHVAVSRTLLEASPLGHLLDALPVIGTALAKRVLSGDGGKYRVAGGDEVTVRSDVLGGLFVWTRQLERHGGRADKTIEEFTHWLWSGNGFSKERYAKLGLARPKPPKEWLEKKALEDDEEEQGGRAGQHPELTAGTSYGLEGLRLLEGMEQPHAAGAITNPTAYQNPSRKTAAPAKKPTTTAAKSLLKSLGSSGGAGATGFGNPTRKFAP